MTLFKIANGAVYDPANGIDGRVQDIWLQDGKVVSPPTDPDVRADKILDAAGLVVMPGGVDMHSHIAGPKVNAARKLVARTGEGEIGRGGDRETGKQVATSPRLPLSPSPNLPFSLSSLP